MALGVARWGQRENENLDDNWTGVMENNKDVLFEEILKYTLFGEGGIIGCIDKQIEDPSSLK